MTKRYVLLIFLAMSLGTTWVWAQAQKAPKDPKASAGAEAPAPPAKAAPGVEPGTYIIGEEDVLDISVWQQPNVSRSVPVRPDGRISIPLVNDIQAAGLTPMQLANSITDKLKEFLNKPQVTVTVVQINSQKVFVVGEVSRPGPMMLLPNMTALQALSSAGGPTQFADVKRAYLMRHEGGKDVTFPLNYKDLLRGDMHTNITLKAGDTIVVP
jgi:polysaccharide export outer membrane protein